MKGQAQKEARYIKSAPKLALKIMREVKKKIHTGTTTISSATAVIIAVLGVSDT